MATALYSHKLSESKYSNWIKAGLAVLFTKEGIEPFVYDEIDHFRQNSLTDICNNNGLLVGTTCSNCCTENVVVCPTNRTCNVGRGKCSFHRNSATQYFPSGCPNKICHNLKTDIQRAHRYYGPSYKNTDATQWCNNTWEVAKCFMPPDGYKEVRSVTETDFNGMNSVIINYKDFQAKVQDDLSKKGNIFDKGRDIGKSVRHSPTLEVEDTDLQQYFSDLQNLLSDPTYLAANTNAQNARQKLAQLQNDTLVIGIDEVRKVLDDVANVVKDKIRTEKDEYRKAAEKQKLGLVETTNKFVSTIEGQGKVSISELDKALKSAIDEIEKVKMKSVKQIKEETGKGLKNLAKEGKLVSEEVKEGVQKMETLSKVGVKKIAKETENAMKQIQSSSGGQIKTIETVAVDGVKQIASETNTAVKQIQSSSDEQIKTIETAADDGVKQIASETATAVKQIQSSSDGQIEKMETVADDEVKKIAAKTDNAVKQIQSTADGQIKTMVAVVDDGVKKIALETDQTILRFQGQLTTANKESEDDKYNQLKKDFKSDLLAFNQRYHSTIPLSPVFEEHETPLQGFYVQPKMNSIEVQKPIFSGHAEEVRKPIKCLQDVFRRKSKDCENIYLTSGAGQGKTTFCKYLVLTWCRAHGNESRLFAEEDIRVMKDFEYIFLVSLRDSPELCDVDDMIAREIVKYLSQRSKYTPEFLQTLFHRERCLVLLDGLDEWSHPSHSVSPCGMAQNGLPHRKARQNCTILTTTRSWKLSVVNLKSRQIDNHVEIGNLNKVNSRQLVANAVRNILDQDEDAETQYNDRVEVQIKEIEEKISSRSIPEFETNPLLLTYMICLLCDGKSLGRSKCDLYANILDFLLHRWKKRNNKISNTVTAENTFDSVLLPAVFRNCIHTRTYEKFLLSLGQLAFQTLFCENEERSLVFESSLMDSCLNEEEQKFSLSAGLLIQNQLPGRLTTRDTTVSFSHKTFQEFFAALYIYSKSDLNEVIEPVIKKCNSLENILEMSHVFIFLSGICHKRLHAISKCLSKVINDDTIITEYRSASKFYFVDSLKPVKNLQNMYIACVKESQNAKHVPVYPLLQDAIIDRDHTKQELFQMLQYLIKKNIANMKSIRLSQCELEMSTKELVKNLNIDSIRTLESLHILRPIASEDLERILAGSVKTLKQVVVYSLMHKSGSAYPIYTTLSNNSTKSIQNMTYLISLHLIFLKTSHHLLDSLISYLNQRTCMRQIMLSNIKCIDHNETCPGFSMDLSQHAQLTSVGLSDLALVHVEINTSILETCVVGQLQTLSAFSSFLHCLLEAKKLRSFICNLMRNENDLNTMMAIIPQLVTVTHIVIGNADIQTIEVLQLHPDNVNIKLFSMHNTTVSSLSLEQLVQQVQQFQQCVVVELRNCTVKPVEENERIKHNIKSSDKFEILLDGEKEDYSGQKLNAFEFRTNKT